MNVLLNSRKAAVWRLSVYVLTMFVVVPVFDGYLIDYLREQEIISNSYFLDRILSVMLVATVIAIFMLQWGMAMFIWSVRLVDDELKIRYCKQKGGRCEIEMDERYAKGREYRAKHWWYVHAEEMEKMILKMRDVRVG
ncbi:hypothetical protein JD969_09200 [Planctomycetota bacterium]|nr:hypothetical protein JD969_09200 [Planctomycetota bacterium]